MDELAEPAGEVAESAADQGPGETAEVGESGPAGIAEQAQGAGDGLLQATGDIAGQTEADGSAAIHDAGDIAASAGADGSAALHEAGDLASRAESDGAAVLQEVGNIAVEAETGGADVLHDVGDLAADVHGGAVLHEAADLAVDVHGGAVLHEAGQVAGELGSVGDALHQGDVTDQLETDATDMLSGAEWNADAPPEIGDAGPASPAEQPGEQSDAVALTAFDMVASPPAEPGELGPSDFGPLIGDIPLIGDLMHVVTQVEAAASQVGGTEQQNLPAAEQPSGRGQTR